MARVLSGMRPTGRLHLGHYEGVIRNWLKLQDEATCFFFVADLHALTDRSDSDDIALYTIEMVKDWIALGIDPERAVVFVQSHVPAHLFLFTFLGMVSPVSWLERCPTYKDRVSELGSGSENLGLLSYPVLQAADIALYEADKVPVGEDQVAHLEMAREIVRKINSRYPGASLVEPQPILTASAKLLGTDGTKMSKSRGNTLEMSAPPEETAKKIRGMVTDAQRVRRNDPGEPKRCFLYPYHEIYSVDRTEEICAGCRSAALGCVDCKKILVESLEKHLAPYRERRARCSDADARAILDDGSRRAREAAAPVLARVSQAMRLLPEEP